jgi:hypothetical protein
VVSYATDNTSTQILNEYVSGLKENYPNGTSSYKKIDLLGTQGYYVNFSYAANKTYYSAFAVLNNTAYSVLLNLANQSLYNVSINAFSTILRTLST